MTESCQEHFEMKITDLQDTIEFASDSVHQAESVLRIVDDELLKATKECWANSGHLTNVLYLVKAARTTIGDALTHLERPEVER